MTYADVYQPAKKINAVLYNAVLIMGTSWLLAVSAQLAIPLPFSPIPVTAQTLVVLMQAALLGKERGTAAVGLYLLQGLSGIPVFAGGRAGLSVLLGPTGGYLVGFLAAAYLVGALIEKGWDRGPGTAFAAMAAGNVILYACGLLWLTPFVGPTLVLPLGLYPFIMGDLVKLILAVVLLTISGRLKSHLIFSGTPLKAASRTPNRRL
jgi:biotin transporter BioY